MKEKDNTTKSCTERQLLLNKIYAYLFGKQIVGSKKEMAILIGFNDKNFVSATNGNEKYLTESLFNKIYIRFPETRDINLIEEIAINNDNKETKNNKYKTSDNNINELVLEIKLLRKELEDEKKQNKDQAEAIINFIEKERILVSDLILDLKKTIVEKKENK